MREHGFRITVLQWEAVQCGIWRYTKKWQLSVLEKWRITLISWCFNFVLYNMWVIIGWELSACFSCSSYVESHIPQCDGVWGVGPSGWLGREDGAPMNEIPEETGEWWPKAVWGHGSSGVFSEVGSRLSPDMESTGTLMLSPLFFAVTITWIQWYYSVCFDNFSINEFSPYIWQVQYQFSPQLCGWKTLYLISF